jgi:hypothetical protein
VVASISADELTSGEFLNHFNFQDLVLLEEMISNHRMRASISVLVLNTTSRVRLQVLTGVSGRYKG